MTEKHKHIDEAKHNDGAPIRQKSKKRNKTVLYVIIAIVVVLVVYNYTSG